MRPNSIITNTASYQPGAAHPRFTDGEFVNEHGYVRVSTGRTHMKYKHRTVIEGLILEQAILQVVRVYDAAAGVLSCADVTTDIMEIVMNPPQIPPKVHVHHIDGDRQNNCCCNLMLLDSAIHGAITRAHLKLVRRAERERMMAALRGK